MSEVRDKLLDDQLGNSVRCGFVELGLSFGRSNTHWMCCSDCVINVTKDVKVFLRFPDRFRHLIGSVSEEIGEGIGSAFPSPKRWKKNDEMRF